MPGKCCRKKGKKKRHTPIVSEAQRRLFGAVLSGTSTKATGLSKAEAKRHLKESKGKNLPETAGREYVAERKRQKSKRIGV